MGRWRPSFRKVGQAGTVRGCVPDRLHFRGVRVREGDGLGQHWVMARSQGRLLGKDGGSPGTADPGSGDGPPSILLATTMHGISGLNSRSSAYQVARFL